MEEDFTNLISAKYIRAHINEIPFSSGVYKQYITEDGLDYLDGITPTHWKEIDGKKVFLLYIGKAKNLNERLSWHLGFINIRHSNICNGTLSTLRKSYMANHKEIFCLSDQEKLNSFLDNYNYIEYMITPKYIEIEDKLINKYDLPLNIQGNTHEFIRTNKQRRKEITNKYKLEFQCNKKDK